MSVEMRQVINKRERHTFLTFPWQIYRNDPLWVPPLLSGHEKVIDPERGIFFKDGVAECFIALVHGKPAGTLCLAEEFNNTRAKGYKECMYGFVECVEDYAVFEAMFDFATDWAGERGMESIYGPFNLDREDSRGLLIEGRDRPPPILCGHQPPYYQSFFERYGFEKNGEDGLAYAVDLDPSSPRIQRLYQLSERVRQRHPEFIVRSANLADMDNEIERIVDLQNRALRHFPGYIPYTRNAIESMIMPLLDVIDIDLVLFAEVEGQPAGFFPGVPNFNELLIKLNGLRYPWDYLRYLLCRNLKPECLAIKSVVVPPEYWDIGVAVLLFDKMVQRAIEKGYKWADLSLTGDENPNTWPLAHHMGAQIYKRYRFYKKQLT
ncbi:MAG: GNAT family N-acetyltransferase [Anaerolineales bacterium]|jgi:GNAT superfamily N-acetyltransferase